MTRVPFARLARAARGACAAACLVGSAIAVAAPAGAADELLFMSNRSGNVFEPYRMSALGGAAVRALPEQGEVSSISWSPDGTRLLYSAARNGGLPNVYVTRLSDGVTTQLTHDPLPCTEPAWSPDGRTIAFVATRGAGTRKIWLMDADGSRQRRLTEATIDDEIAPRFSPDGSKLAYLASNDTLAPRVAVADLRSGRSGIVPTPAGRRYESPPEWSPDGTRLLFSEINGSAQVISMAPDGSDRKALTQADARNTLARWSSDGRQILFLSIPRTAARQSLHVMNADGSELRLLHGGTNDVMDARWSADGRHIYFVEHLPEGGKLFAIDPSGQGLRRLSGGEGFDINLSVCCQRPAVPVATAQPR